MGIMHIYCIECIFLLQMDQWCQFSQAEMTIMEALNLMNKLVDESDPDVSRLAMCVCVTRTVP